MHFFFCSPVRCAVSSPHFFTSLLLRRHRSCILSRPVSRSLISCNDRKLKLMQILFKFSRTIWYSFFFGEVSQLALNEKKKKQPRSYSERTMKLVVSDDDFFSHFRKGRFRVEIIICIFVLISVHCEMNKLFDYNTIYSVSYHFDTKISGKNWIKNQNWPLRLRFLYHHLCYELLSAIASFTYRQMRHKFKRSWLVGLWTLPPKIPFLLSSRQWCYKHVRKPRLVVPAPNQLT